MKQRNFYFDFLRGIAIMMVIGIHTCPVLTNFDSLESIITITFRQILNCAVPLFLAISGFFIAKKDLSSKENILKFWRKQIPTVYIPCLICSMGWFVLDIFDHGINGVFYKLVKLLICGYSVYYFIALITQLYIVTPWLLRVNKLGG